MRYGLLQASCIPPQGQRARRDPTRYRTKLVQERSGEVNRVQGVVERANIKLASVASEMVARSTTPGSRRRSQSIQNRPRWYRTLVSGH